MKRNLVTMTALCLIAGAVLATDAEAGRRRDRSKPSVERTEMPAQYAEPHRFDRDPTMSFHRGVLRRDGLAGWKVGDFALQMGPNAVVLGPDGQPAMLVDGQEALVMGSRFGETYMGWSVRLLEPERLAAGSTTDTVKKPSDSSPDVGEIVSAPR